jgi:membrane-bound lytic murein transglycosylase B
MKFRFAVVVMLAVMPSWACAAPSKEFSSWVGDLRQEAGQRGIDLTLFDRAFEGVEPIERVIELDRRQPEFTLTFWKYLNGRVTEQRIDRGRRLMAEHRELLNRIHAKYGVQPRFLVSFWGLESNFGDYTGKIPLIGALATLAYDERRSKFFREQLLAALTVMQRGDIPVRAQGSWAGAMGQTQFIPTTYRDFAVDGDGDGKRDLWGSLADIFASSANYLSQAKWDDSKTWGREVRLPKGFDIELAGLNGGKRLAEWQALGVRRIDGRNLPAVDIDAWLVLPSGHDGPAFLVYQNFKTTLVWNRSIFYAIAVGHLADRIAGKGPLQTPRPAQEVALNRSQVIEIQKFLAGEGLYSGPHDGIAGSGTRAAAKAYQKSVGLPPDGHVDWKILEHIRAKRP